MRARRDVETDLRERLVREARIAVSTLRRGQGTPDSVIDYLVRRAYGSPDRLLDASDRLGEPDLEARALLRKACRRAADPQPPAPGAAVLPARCAPPRLAAPVIALTPSAATSRPTAGPTPRATLA
jgi:hypothetical protein